MKHFTTEIFQLANGKGMITCHHFAAPDEVLHPGNGPQRLIQEKKRDEPVPRYSEPPDGSTHATHEISCPKGTDFSLSKPRAACRPLGSPIHPLKEPVRSNYFHSNRETLFAFSTVLAFALTMPKQRWVKLPAARCASRGPRWHQ